MYFVCTANALQVSDIGPGCHAELDPTQAVRPIAVYTH
jgi:hypothetical protein